MRIAFRLWLALLVAIALVLGAGLLARIEEEQRLLVEVTLRDRRFFAHALHAALAREHGARDPLAEAQGMLDREEVAAAHIVARLVALDGAGGFPRPLLPPGELALLARGEITALVRGDEILTYVPLETDGALVLELAEPQAINALLARIGWRSLVAQTVALAALAGLVSFALVGWLVGRPLARLALLARRIGAGDLDARAALPPGRDEVAVLAREMNAMAEGLEAARRALEQADAERVGALEQLRHADRLRTVGQLASALAHELGTPLNVVSGHARLIEEDSTTGAEGRGSAHAIVDQTTRMTKILRSLLDFSRRSARRSEPIELAELADQAAATLAPLARRDGVRIDVARAESAVRVRADGHQLLQVLTNLLMNAMQSMRGGGTVTVRIDEVDAIPPTGVHAPAGRYARVRVEDHGTGIDAEDLPHLFEPFFTRKAEGEGTGLGLAVAQGIVRDHRGWITVESAPGAGTSFDVMIPVLVE
jgi:two-component system NtrC family sensor kinase